MSTGAPGSQEATVRAYDPATRDVVVLLDDGRRVQVPGPAVDARLRLLRPGQRVRLRSEGGAVVALGHPGLPTTPPDARCSPAGSTMGP